MMQPCCDKMRTELERRCDHGHDRFECPDSLVMYIPKYDEYGIIVHDGGTSMVQILFCPWCGTRLPEPKRERWFDELERRGIDPLTDKVPVEFETDAWYLKSR